MSKSAEKNNLLNMTTLLEADRESPLAFYQSNLSDEGKKLQALEMFLSGVYSGKS